MSGWLPNVVRAHKGLPRKGPKMNSFHTPPTGGFHTNERGSHDLVIRAVVVGVSASMTAYTLLTVLFLYWF